MATLPRLPRFYPIVDAGMLARAGISVESFARELRDAGIRFLQYRDKDAPGREVPDREILDRLALLRSIFPSSDSILILNDRVRLVQAAHLEGVHVGQEDMPPGKVRDLLGPQALIGFSTHDPGQLLDAAAGPADYLAVGPVFMTTSKQNPDPVIGLEGVRAARRLTGKPLVAIGGITRANCAAVLEAGATSVAVISDLIPGRGESTQRLAQEFLMLTGAG